MAKNVNKLQIPVTDTESFKVALAAIPEQSLLYNDETFTLYQKVGKDAVAIGSLVSYTKGISALHYEGEIEEEISEYPESETYTNGTILHIKVESVLYPETDDEVTLYEDSFIINIGTETKPDWHQVGKGGGAGGDDIVCKTLSVTSKNNGTKDIWKANLFLGNTGKNGHYILFNNYSTKEQTFSSGHFLIRGKSNVFLYDVLVNITSGGIQNMVNTGIAPVDLYSVTYKGKQYYALHTSSDESFDIYYTGWISSDFRPFSYTEAELSNFSRLALGELDLENIPVLEGVPEPRFAWSDSGETIRNYVNHWDFDENPVCYLRITGGPAQSKDFRNICNPQWLWDNSFALSSVLGDSSKPVHLILDQCTNYDYCATKFSGLQSDGTQISTPYGNFSASDFGTQWRFQSSSNCTYNGLSGLILPQDENSSNGPGEWDFMFCSGLKNLTSLKMNQYTKKVNTGNLQGLTALTSVTFPEVMNNLNTDGETAPLIDSNKLQAIYFPNKEEVVKMNGYTSVTKMLYWCDDFNFYVPGSMLQDYKEEYQSIGYLSGLFRAY